MLLHYTYQPPARYNHKSFDTLGEPVSRPTWYHSPEHAKNRYVAGGWYPPLQGLCVFWVHSNILHAIVGEDSILPRGTINHNLIHWANPYHVRRGSIHRNTQLSYLAGGWYPPLRWCGRSFLEGVRGWGSFVFRRWNENRHNYGIGRGEAAGICVFCILSCTIMQDCAAENPIHWLWKRLKTGILQLLEHFATELWRENEFIFLQKCKM